MQAQKKENRDAVRPAFASLTAGLLARKGEAHPAPAHLDGVSFHAKSAEEFASEAAEAASDARAAGQKKDGQPDKAAPPVAKAAHGCCAWTLPESALVPLPPGQRHSMGLRLDDERLRKVKILAARAGVSNQKVMLAALDDYLSHMTETLAAECPCLARSMLNRP